MADNWGIRYDICVYQKLRDSDDPTEKAGILSHFFYSLFAAMECADNVNFAKIAEAFPVHARLFAEFKADNDLFCQRL